MWLFDFFLRQEGIQAITTWKFVNDCVARHKGSKCSCYKLSAFGNNTSGEEATKWRKKTSKLSSTNHKYNQKMGGVDRNDQLKHSYCLNTRGYKANKYIFYFVLMS